MKGLAKILCVLMAMTLLSACGKGTTPPAGSGGGSSAAEPSGSSSGGQTQGTTNAAEEFSLPYTGDFVTYSGLAGDMGMDDNEDAMVLKEWRARTGNVKIEWSLPSGDDYATRLNLAISSGNLPDIIWTGPITDFISQNSGYGYFLNLADYIEYMPNLSQAQKDFPALASMNGINGEIWGIGDVEPYDFGHETFYVNLTNLKAIGAEIPETWEEAIAAMELYKSQNADATPFVTYWTGVVDVVNRSLNGYKSFFFNSAGKWDHALLNEQESRYKETVSITSQLYTKGLIHPEYASLSGDTKNQILMDGKWLFAWLTGSCIEDYAFRYNPVPYEYGLAPVPSLKKGEPHYNSINFRRDLPPTYGYVVNASVEKPELMASLLDLIISEEASTLYNWGIEGTTFEIDPAGGQKRLINGYDAPEKMREAGIRQFTDVRLVMRKDRISEIYSSGMSERETALYVELADRFISGELTPYIPRRETPVMSDEAREANAQILTPMQTYIDENLALFIDGTRPMSDWDTFVAEVTGMGDLQTVLDNYEAGRQVLPADTRVFLNFHE